MLFSVLSVREKNILIWSVNFECVLYQQTTKMYPQCWGAAVRVEHFICLVCLWRWIWGSVLRWTLNPRLLQCIIWPFSKHRFSSLPYKTSPHTAYNSHIQMEGWKKDGFWLLSLCLLNCPFPKTIQLKPIVLYFHKAHDI